MDILLANSPNYLHPLDHILKYHFANTIGLKISIIYGATISHLGLCLLNFFSRGLYGNTSKVGEQLKTNAGEGLGDAKELHTPIWTQRAPISHFIVAVNKSVRRPPVTVRKKKLKKSGHCPYR